MSSPVSRLTPSDGDGLVERDRELGALREFVDATVAGGSGVLVVEGPAGIGKSGLLTALRARAQDAGMRILAARASELERDFPFGLVRQLFDPALADPAARERWLTDAAAPAAAVFDAPAAGDEGPAGGDASFSMLHGLHWLTVNAAADGPLLLAIDDLQWSDRPSLRFLAYLARRVEGLPVLVAATLRTGEPDTDLALVSEVAADPAAVVLRPGPLSVPAVTTLVRSRLGEDADAGFCRACHEATGGNPLLLRQLLTALEADEVHPTAERVHVVREIGPRAASRGVLVRLARLPRGAIPVARAVAVLGENAALPAVAALAGLDEAAAAESIADLSRAEILRPDTPLGFVHPLVRDAVHRDLQAGELELAHDRAARLLLDAGAPADRVAAHLLHVPCRGDAWVAELLVDAARAAIRRGAPESAVAYFERALAEPAPDHLRPPLLFELGMASWISSGRDALPGLEAAYAAQRDPLLRGLAGFGLARTFLFTGTPGRCREVAAEVVQELPDELDDLRLALRALDAAALFFGAGGSTDPDRLASHREVPPGAGLGARMLACMALLDSLLAAVPAQECARRAGDVLADDVLVSGDPGLFWVTPLVTLAVADRAEVVGVWEDVEARVRANGSAFGVLTVNIWRGFTLTLGGELVEAEEQLREGLHQAVLWGLENRSNMAYAAAFLARLLVERGHASSARAVLPELPGPGDDSDGSNFSRIAHAEVLLLENRAQEVLALTEELERSQTRVVHPVWAPWRSLRAAALHALDRTEEGLALALEELELARRWGSPNVVGRGLRIAGELEGEAGIPRLQEACDLLAGSHARAEHARALAALGTALRLARRPTDAREPLREALDLADRCGADALAERVRSELYATGSRPRTTALGGIESLTARERRVAELAAGGATNRDVAQALYVTPKTVEVHLSNTYRKLGIRGRRELATALGTGSTP